MQLGACSPKIKMAGGKPDTRKNCLEGGVVGGKMMVEVGKKAMDLRKEDLQTT